MPAKVLGMQGNGGGSLDFKDKGRRPESTVRSSR